MLAELHEDDREYSATVDWRDKILPFTTLSSLDICSDSFRNLNPFCLDSCGGPTSKPNEIFVSFIIPLSL